ncbi:MAG: sugar phosphate isomerase/epimerase [Ruminococcaceae bacterium]|nr:sugar phosphate isomerase/epimerase [Oscillospiraceae bacterium]
MSASMMDGSKIPVIVPTRYYAYACDTQCRFSSAAMVDFVANSGFDGLDLSFDLFSDLGNPLCVEGDIYSVLYSLGNRAALRGLTIPSCHLPFYMPSPDDAMAMKRYVRGLTEGIKAAAYLKIPAAVIHPIVRHSSVCNYNRWKEENLAFLSPLQELAGQRGVTLCIENMTGVPYPSQPKELVFGSRAKDIRWLADKLDTGICWDFGHANLTGLCQSAELSTAGDRLRMVHIHDNNGKTDNHLNPFDREVDWQDAAEGLRAIGFSSMSWRCLNMEIKTSHLSSDLFTRQAYAAKTLNAAKRLASLI